MLYNSCGCPFFYRVSLYTYLFVLLLPPTPLSFSSLSNRICLFYLTCIIAIIFAVLKRSQGLESTYETRKKCLQDTFVIVMSYISYSVLVLVLAVVIVGQRRKATDDQNGTKVVENILSYVIALRY
jgi:hypothetical protein